MRKRLAFTLFTIAVIGLPAFAQEAELEGAPGYLKRESAKQAEAPRKVLPPAPLPKAAPVQMQTQAQASTEKLKAEQARIAQLAEAQKVEEARLAKQAADLRAQQARLDARAATLAAEEARLAQLRDDQAADHAAKLAELSRRQDEARAQRPTQTAELSRDDEARDDEAVDREDDEPLPSAPTETRRPVLARLDYDAARLSCTRAAEDEVAARNFYSARYDTPPSFFRDGGWELRGRMRLQDRRGYLLVDTVCEVTADGHVQDFAILR